MDHRHIGMLRTEFIVSRIHAQSFSDHSWLDSVTGSFCCADWVCSCIRD